MHYPLPFHKNAKLAAQAAMFAQEHGKFWEMHDLLFENRNELEKNNLLQYATQIGLNADELSTALDTNQYEDAVDANMKKGNAAGVSGTPSFFINGEMVVGAQPLDIFQKAVDKALKRANQKAKPDSKTKPGKKK